jgi:hypothetical protein
MRRSLWIAMGAAGMFAGLSAWGLVDEAKKKSAQMLGMMACKLDCPCQCNMIGCGCHEREKPFTPSRPKGWPEVTSDRFMPL